MLKKSVEIEIPAKDPFQNDMLGRRRIAESLTLLVESTKQPSVLSVQAPWGWGMTTFIKMWKAQLEARGHVCFYFNAWENDFVEDPLIAFVGEIHRTLAEKSSTGQFATQLRKLQNVGELLVRRALPLTVQIATQGLLGQESVKKVSDLLFNSGGDIASFASELAEEKMKQYEEGKKGVQEFRNELSKVVKAFSEGAGRKAPAVFFIDELDRCRPEFSVSMLERIMHIFSVKGMVYVLGIDRNQVEQSVKSKYGPGMEADAYLRRFIDFSVNLPEPTVDQYYQLLYERFQLQEVFAKRRDGKNEGEALMRAFVSLSKSYGFSLRVIEQCFDEINLVLRTISPDVRLYSYLLALLIALKTARSKSYSLLLDDLLPVDVKTLLDEIKQDLDVSDQVCRWMLAQFEVYLIFGCLNESNRADALAELKTGSRSDNPVERRYAQQVLRFAEKIQYDLYYKEVRDLISQISLIDELTVSN